MRKGNFRLERVARKGQVHFYLAKDLRIGKAKSKVTKYVGTSEPSTSELEQFIRANRFDIEIRAIEKKAEMSARSLIPHPFDPPEGLKVIGSIERFRFLYQACQELLSVDEAAHYEEQLEHQYVGGTTAIEGNTLTLRQTHLLLKEGMVPDKPLREINEVQNFRLVKHLRDSHKGKITIEVMKRFHSLVMSNIDTGSGELRRVDDIIIVGREGSLCPSVMIEGELHEAIDEYYHSMDEGMSPFIAAVLFHHRFECVHPFTDGNGRVGREVFNLMLMMNKYPRMVFLGRDRERYLHALSLGDDGDEKGMVKEFAALLISQRTDIAEAKLRSLTDNERSMQTGKGS